MNERPREWRLAADFSDQTVVVRSVSGRDRDFRALALVTHRAYPEMFEENRLAALMENASGRANLGVAVRGDVVHQEIDEATSLLQDGEKIDDFGVGLVSKRRSGDGGGGFRGGSGRFGLRAIGEDGDKQQNSDPRNHLRQDVCIRCRDNAWRQRHPGWERITFDRLLFGADRTEVAVRRAPEWPR